MEVDAICMEVYGDIYRGNTNDPETTATKYMKMYDGFIYKAKKADIEDLAGRERRMIQKKQRRGLTNGRRSS